jgi:hypothetical protein
MLIKRGDAMNTVTACVGSAACFTLMLVSTANAQDKPPVQTKERTHRMEVYNGPYRTVHYFSDGASAEEEAKLRETERNENEAALADQLQALRRQYVADESLLERRRRDVQWLFYGHSNVISSGLYPYGYGYYAPYGYSYYAPYNSYGSSWYGYPYSPGFGSVTSMNGLFGVGDEGRIKSELAKSLAAQVMPAPKR